MTTSSKDWKRTGVEPQGQTGTGIWRLALATLAACALALGCNSPRDDADTPTDAGSDGSGDATSGGGGSSGGKGSGGSGSSGSGATIGSGGKLGAGGVGSGGTSGGSASGGSGGNGSGSSGSGGLGANKDGSMDTSSSNGSGGVGASNDGAIDTNSNSSGSGGTGSGGFNTSGTGGIGSGGTTSGTGGMGSGGTTSSTGGKGSGGTTASTGGTASGGTTASTGGTASGGTTASTGGHASGGTTASTGGHGTGGQGSGGAASGGSNPCGSNSCTTPASGWTVGTFVNGGASCPSDYSGTKTSLHSGTPKATCSGGSCKCGAVPSSGVCQMPVWLTIDSTTTYIRYPTSENKKCNQLLADAVTDSDTLVESIQPGTPSWVPCNSNVSGSCPTECNAVTTTTPTLSATWDSSMDFCALSSSAANCGSTGKCTSGKICVMASGNQACPSGFTPQGTAGGWFTGTTAGTASCGCGGCGKKTDPSCAYTEADFYNLNCNSGTYLGYFDYSNAGYSFYVYWPARSLAVQVTPPWAGTCNAAQVTTTGSFGTTGQTTVCCQ